MPRNWRGRRGPDFTRLRRNHQHVGTNSCCRPGLATHRCNHLNCENYGGNPGYYLNGLFRTKEVHFIKTPEPHLELCLKRINQEPHICAGSAFSTSIAAIGQLSAHQRATEGNSRHSHFIIEKLEKYLLPLIFTIIAFSQKSLSD